MRFIQQVKEKEANGRAKNFIEENSKIELRDEEGYKEILFECPACQRITGIGFNENSKHGNKKRAVRYVWGCFQIHLIAKIRLVGDVKHIKLLIRMIGKKLALEVLEVMAKRNMIVALKLKVMVNELRRKEANKK